MRSLDARYRLALVVAVTVLVADQMTKMVVERVMMLHETIPVTSFFAFTYVRNTGAAFGVLAAAPSAVRLPLFFAVTLLAAAALVSLLRGVRAEHRWVAAALGGVLGGAAGNLVCRVRYGEVIDFFDLHWGALHWPAFNVADAAITVGVALFLLHSLVSGPADAARGPAAAASTTRP